MKRRHKRKPKQQRDIAKDRIIELFSQAELRFKKNPELSDRYIEIARKISMKYKVKIPRELKKRFCKHCYKYLVPGTNSRVRLTKSKLVYYCNSCKKYMRYPY